MFVRIYRKGQYRNIFIAFAFLLALAGMLMYAEALQNGIRRGLSVCTTVIIPTLYPFMILTALLTDSPLCRKPGRISAWFARLFGLPPCCGPAILISLLGGYPAGAIGIGRLLKEREITNEEATRMTAFCINGGPGFIIGTVGFGLLGSTGAGVLLFAAQITVSVVIGLLIGKKHRKTQRPRVVNTFSEPGHSPVTAVKDTCGSLLTLCGFVMLASAILSVTDAAGIPAHLAQIAGSSAGWSRALAATLEVSCGCIALAGVSQYRPFLLGVCIGWGGLSVHGQVLAAIDSKIPLGQFFLFRLLNGLLTGTVSALLFRFIPVTFSVAAVHTAKIGAGSVSASLMLLVLSYLAMVCFSENSSFSKKTVEK